MISQKKENEIVEERAWWQPALMMFVRLSVWIAAPVLLGAYVGKVLDKKYDSDPILFMSLVGFSFLISMFGIVKETMKEYKRIEEEDKRKKDLKL